MGSNIVWNRCELVSDILLRTIQRYLSQAMILPTLTRHTTGYEFNRQSTTKCVTFKPAIHVVLKGLTLCHYQAMSQQTTQQKPFTTTQSVNAVTYRAPFTVLVLR